MPSTLYIENLPPNDGGAGVERLLSRFGPVRCTAAATDPDMLRRRPGMALVELDTPVRARAALRALDGTEFRGGTLRVRWAVAGDAARVRWACRWDDPRGDAAPRGRRAGAAADAAPRAPARAKPARAAAKTRKEHHHA
jgi:RNA recognition motif-containing protein